MRPIEFFGETKALHLTKSTKEEVEKKKKKENGLGSRFHVAIKSCLPKELLQFLPGRLERNVPDNKFRALLFNQITRFLLGGL